MLRKELRLTFFAWASAIEWLDHTRSVTGHLYIDYGGVAAKGGIANCAEIKRTCGKVDYNTLRATPSLSALRNLKNLYLLSTLLNTAVVQAL